MLENALISAWDHYTLKIKDADIELNLAWKDVDKLAFYSTLQSGIYGGQSTSLSKQIFFEKFPEWIQNQWNHHRSLTKDHYQNNQTILDIGSGLGLIDLIQAKSNPSLDFILVDKQILTFKQGIYYSESYPFYNDWTPTIDCIENSNIKNKFSFLDPKDHWNEVDHVISYFSWCFHYPKSIYWDKIINSLKVGGTLCIDVRLLHEQDVIGEISEEFKSIPRKDPIPNRIPKHIDDYPSPDSEVMGYRCMWKRNR